MGLGGDDDRHRQSGEHSGNKAIDHEHSFMQSPVRIELSRRPSGRAKTHPSSENSSPNVTLDACDCRASDASLCGCPDLEWPTMSLRCLSTMSGSRSTPATTPYR